MSLPRDILVITTATPAKGKIKKHLKPVTSHVVAGTNILSDVFASWSDVFGGRSKSYQNQLTSLYKEAIERLQLQAYHLGADCIVGLKIDIDEISGGGKSMFMITAIGTAAIFEKEGSKKLNGKEIIDGGVSIADMEDMKTRKRIIQKGNEEALEYSKEIWEYLIRNHVAEAYPFLLKKFQKSFDDAGVHNPDVNFKDNFKAYLGALNREDQVELIYKTLHQKELGKSTQRLMMVIIESDNLLDFNELWKLLKSDEFKVRKRALEVIKYDKPYYDYQDLEELEKIQKYIHENFEKEGKYTSKKQLLTGKEVEVWECSCEKQNHIEIMHCSKCNKDIYGFYPGEVNPPEIFAVILEKIDLIKRLLPKSETSAVS